MTGEAQAQTEGAVGDVGHVAVDDAAAEPLSLFPIESTPPADPAADRTVTFLHTADWQLGMTRHFLSGEAQHTYAAAREDAVSRIGRVAASTGAEFVVVCGDVFDDPRVSTRTIRRTLDALGDYPVPVYLLPGNHDPLDATSVYSSAEFTRACPDNVVVLDTAGAVRVRDGVTLIAAPWTTKRPLHDLVTEQIRALAPSDDIRVVVGHGGLDSLTPDDDPSILSTAAIDAAVADQLVDYVALGDRHSVTSVGGSGRVWYSGAPEVTAFDHVETDPGHVLEVTLTRGAQSSVDVTRHRVGQWAFRTIREDVDSAADVERLATLLGRIDDKPRTVVQLGLTGTVTVAEHVALGDVIDEFGDRFAALTVWERHHDLTVVADPADVDVLDLQGYAADTAGDLVERAASADPEEAAAARSALALLHRLAGAGR
ncbi:metallophosphoesterase family protein [Gordonia shandongensis]|uniref:metallophosphoesterase family protein n=1 Tax=Gordonia shandongensis TaxID=376351 RepID=UPI00040E362B|nr:DNA repair exonuclease [Gordonia shandongensis]